jgi:protein-disulfide isomerase
MGSLARAFGRWGQGLAKLGLLGMLLVWLGMSGTAPVVFAAPADLEKQVLEIIRKNPQVILEAVQEYQQRQYEEQQRQQQKLAEEFGRQLRQNPRAVIGDSPRTGSESLRLVLVEFSDFQCPFCARAHQTLKEFMARHGDEVTLVYKHLPLTSIHPEAMAAARAAWAAHRQGKFWEFHDELFANQSQLGEEFYVATAQKAGLERGEVQSGSAQPGGRAGCAARHGSGLSTGHQRYSPFHLERHCLLGGSAFGSV